MTDDVMGEYDSAAKLAFYTVAVGAAISSGFLFLAIRSNPVGLFDLLFVVMSWISGVLAGMIVPAAGRNAYVSKQIRIKERLESKDSE